MTRIQAPKPKLFIIWHLCLMLFLVLAVNGCGLTQAQRQAVSAVAGASQGLGNYAREEFGYLRKANIDLSVYYLSLRTTANLSQVKLDRAASLENVSVRVQAAQALSRYGELLSAILEEGRKDMESAAQSFADSTKNLLGDDLSAAQKGALARLVKAAGSYWLESRRAEALTRILPDLKEPVEKICNLLMRDFSQGGHGLLQDSSVVADRLEEEVQRALAKSTRADERLAAAQAHRLVLEVKQRQSLMQDQAQKALGGLISANREMLKALEEKTYSREELKSLAGQVVKLVEDARTLALDD